MLKALHWKYQPNDSGLFFDPTLRKATTLMKLAVLGLNPLIAELSANNVDLKSMQTFVGSIHGEIEPTLNFLKGLAQKKGARPFLFQNSLHHSTTGFVSQKFQLLGPCYSICAISEPQPELLRAGALQNWGREDSVLFIHGESFPKELSVVSEFKEENDCEILWVSNQAIKNHLQKKTFDSFEQAYAEIVDEATDNATL